MGLHANVHQLDRAVSIALSGEFRTAELDQLRAILSHFHGRGCRRFMLDLSSMAPLGPEVNASLNRLIGRLDPRCEVFGIQSSAIRLLADPPAARPQTGCGDRSFAAAQACGDNVATSAELSKRSATRLNLPSA